MGVNYEWKTPSVDHVEIVGPGAARGDGTVEEGCLGVALFDGGGGVVIEDTPEALWRFAQTILQHTEPPGLDAGQTPLVP